MTMMKSLLFFSVSALCFLSGCKIAKYTVDKLPSHQLIFGSGGGFSGLETTFILLENGQVFRQTGVDDVYEELKPIRRKKARDLFSKLSSLQLYKLDIENPGNMYYFLREVTDKLDSKVTWGAGDYLPPQALISLYKELSGLVKEKNATSAGTVTTPSGKKETKDKNEENEVIKW